MMLVEWDREAVEGGGEDSKLVTGLHGLHHHRQPGCRVKLSAQMTARERMSRRSLAINERATMTGVQRKEGKMTRSNGI